MQPNAHQEHSHTHGQPHESGHSHDHAHGHSHEHPHPHLHALASPLAPQQTKDLKSPVLSGLAQRLLWVASLLVVLWLIVFWALRTHG
jgi:ABC-type nickel/cobalt efflux system permease component RcnA